ncbi:glycerate dehydrogenase [Grosmannia clavigera kw1407]|uniref:Glycerate dehydrogenase n=1 Tax=Grosmannia clavigera (strain kw1407 / UAMH 11150) TaxID=655863 RepID=F0XJ69_GROCL|nr:glycerate dehydrogenase [Grosmannia clavigera kw1407]EFX02120.1 glycerate dehydrogenase [Grosmannia clavigera kw1407]
MTSTVDPIPSTPSGHVTAAVTPRHFHIVALETIFTGPLYVTVPAPHTCTFVQYERTDRSPGSSELATRLRDADIVLMTTIPMRADILASTATPRLGLLAVMASGTDTIDLVACAARGIRVLNSPGCNAESVAEHAVALYFATRRRLMPSMRPLLRGLWPAKGTLLHTAVQGPRGAESEADAWPRGCVQETAVIVGYGGVGRRVAAMLQALGMTVLVAGRKGDEAVDQPLPRGRTAFAEALRVASVLVLCCPRTPETLGMLSTAEFAAMKKDALLINVSRGGIVDEDALLAALRGGEIGGAGVDVFSTEPASLENNSLLRAAVDEMDQDDASRDRRPLNLVVTPHTAWIASATLNNNIRVMQDNIDGFITGNLVAERVRA